MLETIAGYRKSIGNNQNYYHRRIEKSVTCMRADSLNNSSTPDPIRQFGAHIAKAINSLDEEGRISAQRTSPSGKMLTVIQYMLLLDNIKLPISQSDLSGAQMILASRNNARSPPQNDPSVINPSTPAKINKNQTSSAVQDYSSLMPGAYAAPISYGNEGVIQDIENDTCMITTERKKDNLISAIIENLVSNGQLTADDANDFEFLLRSEAAGAPIFIAHLHDNPNDSSRIKREAESARDGRIMDHITGYCGFEEEVFNDNGDHMGKTLLFYAQRAENPFRMIYDNKDGRPSPESQGLAEGLNISADVITIGLKPAIGRLIAFLLRKKHYNDLGDNICAQRFNKLFIAEMGTSLNADGLMFKRGSRSGKIKPHELFNTSPAQPRAAFYTGDSMTGIRREVLLELKQGKGSINDNGRIVYLKPTKIDNEFITHHPYAIKQELLARKVLVDESNLRWRYADTFDSTGLDVQVREGKKQIKLYGDYYELNQNSAGKFEIVVKKESGIRENIPVYMEPLSRKWHLNVHNEHQVFNNEQKKIVSAIKTNKEDGFYYIPRSNNNEPYYGNGKIYHQEKVNDAEHYLWGRYIEINGELVPVRNSEHEGKGILYEIYDIKNTEKKGYAVEWDGDRWLFEKPTSAHISKNVESFLSDYKHIQNIDVRKLSAPDHLGVRWTVDGESYIKVNKEFYKITLTDEGGIIHLSETKNIGMKLSFGKNQFEKDALLSRATNRDVLTPGSPAHTDQRLNRQGARKIKNTKSLEDVISKDIIRTDFKSGDLSAQNSMGIRKDGSGNIYIRVKNGWVNLSKSDTGYSIPVGNEKVRVEFSKNRWLAAETAPGFPGQLNYFPGEQASVTVSCTDGYSTTFGIDPTKTLTKNILEHFDPIDDGLLFDMKKSKSDKHEFFSINKITIKTSDSERSVYYPDDKPGGFKNSDVLFDGVPVNFKNPDNILIAPSNYKNEKVYAQYPYDLHVMKQGTLDSCGYACLTMIAKDLKIVRNIDESVIKRFMRLNEESTDGAFSSTLSEIMNESGVINKHLNIEDPAKYIQDKMREDRWTGIVNIDGHFCVITKADTNEFYFRDPYQGILSLEKTDKLKNLALGQDIIEM